MWVSARRGAEPLIQIEFRQEDHAAAGCQNDVGGNEQPMRVEDRQRVQQDVICREAPFPDQGQGIRKQIVLGQHGALGTAGRSGGV